MKEGEEMDKKIPLGMSSFSKIIREGYYYVDKTKYIKSIEDFNTKYPVLLRPRRFGKTLFADMLQSYYDVKEKDSFDELFGNTYIGKNKSKLANSYYILHLNLSGLDTRNSDLLNDLLNNVVKEVQAQIKEDVNLIKNAKGAAIVFLGKNCTFKEIM